MSGGKVVLERTRSDQSLNNSKAAAGTATTILGQSFITSSPMAIRKWPTYRRRRKSAPWSHKEWTIEVGRNAYLETWKWSTSTPTTSLATVELPDTKFGACKIRRDPL